MTSIRLFVASITATCLLASWETGAARAAVSHFDDGSFETPAVSANATVNVVAGGTIGPWRVTSGSVDIVRQNYWQAAEGDQSVDLSGWLAGTVAQTFLTVPGKRYSVAYSLAGNPMAGPVVKSGKVLVNGQNFQDFTFDVTGKTNANMGYVSRVVTFVARETSTTLAFVSTTNSVAGPVIDDVTVCACAPRNCCG
ncbi:choice-of-anchor C family protein [Actinomadura sp. NPDC000600]|uniref:choice-of-anchor C family protein n=1 Tax=Actinomadura sp. NPDC000600 TaxID=3154262 RepID=UPI0033927C95